MSDICRVDGCDKERDIKKASKLCSMHRSRWSRHKSFDLVAEVIPEGFVMKCSYHGFITDEQVKSSPYKSTYTSKTLISRACRECIKESQAKNQKNFPEKVKLKSQKHLIKKKYGLSWDEYNAIKDSQNNKCKICRKPESCINHITKIVRELAVDHCHDTGVVRGLLCSKCNFGVGYFDNSIEHLESAIKYLRPHEWTQVD